MSEEILNFEDAGAGMTDDSSSAEGPCEQCRSAFNEKITQEELSLAEDLITSHTAYKHLKKVAPCLKKLEIDKLKTQKMRITMRLLELEYSKMNSSDFQGPVARCLSLDTTTEDDRILCFIAWVINTFERQISKLKKNSAVLSDEVFPENMTTKKQKIFFLKLKVKECKTLGTMIKRQIKEKDNRRKAQEALQKKKLQRIRNIKHATAPQNLQNVQTEEKIQPTNSTKQPSQPACPHIKIETKGNAPDALPSTEKQGAMAGDMIKAENEEIHADRNSENALDDSSCGDMQTNPMDLFHEKQKLFEELEMAQMCFMLGQRKATLNEKHLMKSLHGRQLAPQFLPESGQYLEERITGLREGDELLNELLSYDTISQHCYLFRHLCDDMCRLLFLAHRKVPGHENKFAKDFCVRHGEADMSKPLEFVLSWEGAFTRRFMNRYKAWVTRKFVVLVRTLKKARAGALPRPHEGDLTPNSKAQKQKERRLFIEIAAERKLKNQSVEE